MSLVGAADSVVNPNLRYLNRPYGRVDRPKLKKKLLQRCIDQGRLGGNILLTCFVTESQ